MSCPFLSCPRMARGGPQNVLPVVLAETEVKLQMLPEGSRAALALDFPP